MPKCCRDHVEGRGSADELWPFTARRAPWGRGFGVVGTWPAVHAVVQRAQPGSPGAWHPRLPHGAAGIPCVCLCLGSWLGRERNPSQECRCHPGAAEVETAGAHDGGCGMCPGAGQGWQRNVPDATWASLRSQLRLACVADVLADSSSNVSRPWVGNSEVLLTSGGF